jgi:hypothetical protein
MTVAFEPISPEARSLTILVLLKSAISLFEISHEFHQAFHFDSDCIVDGCPASSHRPMPLSPPRTPWMLRKRTAPVFRRKPEGHVHERLSLAAVPLKIRAIDEIIKQFSFLG